jgi:hypothetical protein
VRAPGPHPAHAQGRRAARAGAVELIREQREDQRSSLTALAERLPLREDLTRPVAVATLHAVTSVEAFVEMRTHGGTSLDATRTTLTRLAETVLR